MAFTLPVRVMRGSGPFTRSEGDVVVDVATAAPRGGLGGADRSGRRRGRPGGVTPPAAGAATAGAILARADELHRVGHDIDRLALRAVGRVPLAPAQPAVDRHRAALAEEPRAVLALGAEHRDREVVRLLDPFPGLLVLAAVVDRDAEVAHGAAARKRLQLRVARQVSD